MIFKGKSVSDASVPKPFGLQEQHVWESQHKSESTLQMTRQPQITRLVVSFVQRFEARKACSKHQFLKSNGLKACVASRKGIGLHFKDRRMLLRSLGQRP